MRERGGTPFRQIFWSRNGAAANIVGHRWNANTEARSGKSRRTRQVDPRSVYFLAQIAPKRGIWHQKSLKKFPGVTPRTPSAEGGDPLPHPPSTATRRARGRKLPRCWDLGVGNRSPESKFITTPLLSNTKTTISVSAKSPLIHQNLLSESIFVNLPAQELPKIT